MFVLKAGSYKSYTILMRTATTEGGQKTAIHEYPGTDVQAVEELGGIPRAFNINIVIPNDTAILTYEDNRNGLLRILEQGGPGKLIHPTFGIVENVVVIRWVIDETITELGRASVTVDFAIDNSTGIPEKAQNSEAETASLNSDLQEKSNADTAGNWSVNNLFAGNFADASAILNSVADKFSDASKLGIRLSDKINPFTADLNRFRNSINGLIGTPIALANTITDLFNTTNELFEEPADNLEVFKSFFGFGDDQTPIADTTVIRGERIRNRSVINNMMNVSALGYAYQAGSQIDFQTVREIDELQEVLETQYEIVADDLAQPLLVIEPAASPTAQVSLGSRGQDDTRKSLDALRVQFTAFLDDERINAKQIITVNVKEAPISTITYAYYGDTANKETLIELNGVDQAAFVEGDIEILTA